MTLDPVSQIDPLSRTVVHLTMQFNEITLATGTGILAKLPYGGSGRIARFNGFLFLITALHNLTGREPNGKAKHTTGALPNCVLCEGYHFKMRFRLYSGGNDPSTDARLYWLHPEGAIIDIALMPLEGAQHSMGTLDQSFLNPVLNEASMPLYVSQTCHIIGFPENLVDRSHANLILPVWKTGHIASEPAFAFCNEPVVLIDATTRPGMSGAPVIVRNEQVHKARRRLVGIYTGRTSDSSDIGKVFRPGVIPKIFHNGPST